VDIFSLFSMFVDRPALALIPALIFAGCGYVIRRRRVWVAAGAWALYTLWEFGMDKRILCSGECNIRIDLFLIIPALIILTILGLVALRR